MNEGQKRLLREVEELFETLRQVMIEEEADPEHPCYTVYSIETDLLNIIRGELVPAGPSAYLPF